MNVTGDVTYGLYLNSALPGEYILPFGVLVKVYFLGKPDISSPQVPQVYPLKIMVFGKLGKDDYGQNVPFVSVNVLS